MRKIGQCLNNDSSEENVCSDYVVKSDIPFRILCKVSSTFNIKIQNQSFSLCRMCFEQ